MRVRVDSNSISLPLFLALVKMLSGWICDLELFIGCGMPSVYYSAMCYVLRVTRGSVKCYVLCVMRKSIESLAFSAKS